MAALLLLTACRSDGRTLDPPTFPLPEPPLLTTETSAAETAPPTSPPPQLFVPWADGGVIPTQYTCDGEGITPALTWTNLPPGTIEVALTVNDLDDDQRTLWIVDAMSASQSGMVEGETPLGAIVRPNSRGERAWEAPCPPPGEEHRYLFTVHALNQQLELADTAPASDVIELLNSVALDQISISGSVVREG